MVPASLVSFWVTWKLRILLLAVGLLLLTGMYFYAYADGRNDCQLAYTEKVQAQAQKDLELAAREALLNKRAAEQALEKYVETEVRHDVIVKEVVKYVQANPNANCLLGDDLVRQLEGIVGGE